jgi:hypothetical protein
MTYGVIDGTDPIIVPGAPVTFFDWVYFSVEAIFDLTFGAYVAYSDYWFDGNMREAATAYNGEWGAGCDKTWNVVGGLSVTATF